ncbi:MAG: DUF6273 domain-containing protein, partial [Coriobacteriales bacterium]|nr:DUF6273 domain-containing protein [Coriobacteriales bacterium]
MRKKILSSVLAAALLLSVMVPIQIADAASITNTPTGVNGRILSASQAGDNSDWVEIATNGDYSLIIRRSNLSIGSMFFSKNGANNPLYSISQVRDAVNNWFNNTLPANARLRSFTVSHDALTSVKTGQFLDMDMALSKPTTTSVKTGNDVAFLLSFPEAARFCSRYYANSYTTVTPSSALAQANYNKLINPYPDTTAYQHNTWYLRSPGNYQTNPSQVASVGGHNAQIPEGSVWSTSVNSGYAYVRPALWVNSSIFSPDQGTIVVKHLDSANMQPVAPEQTYTVAVGNYGPYNPVSVQFYGTGTLAAGSAPASGTIAARETKTITYLYTRGQATIVLQHLDAVSGAAIIPNQTIQVPAGNYGPYSAQTFQYYQTGYLASYSAAAQGTINVGETKTITYLYNKGQATIVVKHLDAVTQNELEPTRALTVDAGSYGPINAMSFQYYLSG